MKLTRRDLDLDAWKQTLFIDDPREWKVWEAVAWLLPVMFVVLIPLAVYVLWRLGEI